jgi:hypothetical protein
MARSLIDRVRPVVERAIDEGSRHICHHRVVMSTRPLQILHGGWQAAYCTRFPREHPRDHEPPISEPSRPLDQRLQSIER